MHPMAFIDFTLWLHYCVKHSCIDIVEKGAKKHELQPCDFNPENGCCFDPTTHAALLPAGSHSQRVPAISIPGHSLHAQDGISTGFCKQLLISANAVRHTDRRRKNTSGVTWNWSLFQTYALDMHALLGWALFALSPSHHKFARPFQQGLISIDTRLGMASHYKFAHYI